MAISPARRQVPHCSSYNISAMSPIGEFRASKPASDNGSSLSSDSYQIFNISVSDSERENFKKFVDRKIGQLSSKPVLPQEWIEKNLTELKSEFRATEGNRRSVNLPNLEQMTKLQEMKDAGEIRDFGLQPYKKAQTIVVDDGSKVLPWWEFFESR